MNTKQISVLWIGISLVMLTGFVPPWLNGDIAGLFFHASFQLDLKKLLIEWFIIAVVTVGWIFTLRGKEPQSNNELAKIPKLAIIAPVSACVIGLAVHVIGESAKAEKKATEAKVEQQQEAQRDLERKTEQAKLERQQKANHILAVKLARPRQLGDNFIDKAGAIASLEVAMTSDDTASYKLTLSVPAGVHYYENVTLDLNDKAGFSLFKRSFLWSGGIRTGSFACDPEVFQRIAQWELEDGISGKLENSY